MKKKKNGKKKKDNNILHKENKQDIVSRRIRRGVCTSLNIFCHACTALLNIFTRKNLNRASLFQLIKLLSEKI